MTVRPSLLLGLLAASGFSVARAQSVAAGPGVELSSAGAANAAAAAATPPAPDSPDPRAFIFRGALPDFSRNAYAPVVESLISGYETTTGRRLAPGPRGKAGIKLCTASGPGLATPRALTDAVVAALEKRGFARDNILLVDQEESRLRDSGYLPALRGDAGDFRYNGSPVLALDTGKFYKESWHYPNSLPSKDVYPDRDAFEFKPGEADRYSLLPVPFIKDVDFWINLPVAADNRALGVAGAIANASLYNVSNARRFWDNPANAAKAAVEIAAIPELRDRMAFSILSLQTYQFVGGPKFDAAFTVSEKEVWLSANPVILDYLMWKRFNDSRRTLKFDPISPEPPLFLKANSGEIRLGSCRPSDLRLVEVK